MTKRRRGEEWWRRREKEGVVGWVKPITVALRRDLCWLELITDDSEWTKCWWERAGRKPCIIHLIPRSLRTPPLFFFFLSQSSSLFPTCSSAVPLLYFHYSPFLSLIFLHFPWCKVISEVPATFSAHSRARDPRDSWYAAVTQMSCSHPNRKYHSGRSSSWAYEEFHLLSNWITS